MSIRDRLFDVRQRIDAACVEAGRTASEVTLIAVSKTHPIAALQDAFSSGQRDFGESYAQEYRDKRPQLSDDIRWHFVGRIQRNKARWIASAHRIHSVTSVAQAQAIAKRSDANVRCLISVNIANEATKSGVAPKQVLTVCSDIENVPGIEIRGLMCLPPWHEDPEQIAPFFAEVADLAARGRAKGMALHELSMGMSHDYRVAIRHGATWVRIGTAIFGPRA